VSRIPLHKRTIDIEAFDNGDEIQVVCHFKDVRPWSDVGHIRTVHEMILDVDVRLADLVITRSEARMVNFPHVECPEIAPRFGDLVGLSIARGYNKEVQKRFIGVAGCTHLEFMARAIGPAIVQAFSSARSRKRIEAGATGPMTPNQFMVNSCHVWAEGGPALEKLAAGWRPGLTGLPTPTVVEIRRIVAEQASES
jgi:hypothetical protein